MAVSFLPQAQIRAGNPLLDLAQLNQGLASVQRSNELQADRAMREQQMAADEKQQNRLMALREQQMAQSAQQNAIENRRADETMSMRRAEFSAGQEEKARARQREDDMRKLQEIEAGAAAAIDNPQIWQSIRQRYTDIDQDLPPEIAADPRATLAYIQRMRGGGSASYSKSAYIMNTPDGRQVMVQPSETGEPKITQLDGLTRSKGVRQVGDQLIDTETGQVVRSVADAIEGEKEAEVIGKARGEAKTSLGKDIAEAEDALNVLEMSLTHPGRKWASGRGTWLPNAAYANTPGAGWIAIVDQIKGKTFLQAYQSLRGGGQITEVEGKKAEQAIARIDRALTPEDFTAAVEDLRDVIKRGVERAKASAGESQTNAAPAAVRGAGGGGGQAELPRIQSQDQFNALPPGTRFIAPDGQERIKP